MTAKRERHQLLAAAALFGFALLYVLSCRSLSIGTPGSPGPGLVPAVIGG
ncbi:MAG TPA: hypothetical protein VFP98_07445 [Candidatus Polarisedimenticolia bacterium]|nr:hypothetical protein [Candidatus Polarisedimenticolia bacterium]